VHNPTSANDFRPISLLNRVLKIITKLLADRLQTKIIPLVHTNQYGFIKTRTIQDCLAWAYEYIYPCQHSKREIVILKLDFTKAFDTIEHNTIIQMMSHLGFGDKWLDWIQRILASGTSSILLNGVPGNHFHCRHGVRQGDPLSPLLFVLAADLLQCIINKGCRNGLFELPIPSYELDQYPIIQYADDTLLVMKASQKELESIPERTLYLERTIGILCTINWIEGQLQQVMPSPLESFRQQGPSLGWGVWLQD